MRSGGRRQCREDNAALTETKRCLGVSDLVDWQAPHYQMANRLAFLYYLRQRCGIPAWLLFVYFTGDRFWSGQSEKVIGPRSHEESAPIVRTAHETLGLPERHGLSEYVRDLCLPATLPRC